jgi:hypothetical protein
VKEMARSVYVWAVAGFEEMVQTENGEEKKRWHKAIRFNDRSDLISQIELFDAKRIQLVGSKKEAEWLAEDWDNCARRNGDYRWK